MPAPVRVLLVDDAEESRETLRRALAFDDGIEVVGEASSGREAIERTDELRPHVILMDVRMPGSDGIEATRDISRRFPDVMVLALTAYDDPSSVRDMLAAGALGYLVKGASVDELASAIRKAQAGEGRLDERVLPHVLSDLRTLLKEERGRRAEAERLAQARQDFIQILSHELRTPLTVIGGALQFLDGERLPEGGDQLVGAALKRVDELERVVEGLELIGEGPAGPDAMGNPAEAVETALGKLGNRPDEVEVGQESWCGVHTHHLSRVMFELVANALRHGQRPATLRVYREGLEGVVVVTDAGDFEPDARLFGAFVAGDMSTQRTQGGFGLGLFVAARLCEANGGRLEVRRAGDHTVAEGRFLLSS